MTVPENMLVQRELALEAVAVSSRVSALAEGRG